MSKIELKNKFGTLEISIEQIESEFIRVSSKIEISKEVYHPLFDLVEIDRDVFETKKYGNLFQIILDENSTSSSFFFGKSKLNLAFKSPRTSVYLEEFENGEGYDIVNSWIAIFTILGSEMEAIK